MVEVARQPPTLGSRQEIGRSRLLILVFALPALVIKCLIAARTFGTNDIVHWGDFLAGEKAAGPVGIYGLKFAHSFYNHPPLIGYYLALLNLLEKVGLHYSFVLRSVSSLADVGTAFLVFELLRRRYSLKRATNSAIAVAVSPALVMVSGFHGNTDPVFAFFVFLGLFLLVDRRMALPAGVAIAVAVSIKIVPMVVIPCLLVYAFRQDIRTLLRFAVGFILAFAVIWLPAMAFQFRALRLDVFGYSGSPYSPWGIVQIGHWLGNPGWVGVMTGPGRSLVVVICALVPAFAVWRRPGVVLPAVAWSLIGFLALAPAWGVQYMVWPLAACYLIGFGWGNAYNASASVVLFLVYNRWSGGLPWYRARANALDRSEVILAFLCWMVLLAALIRATVMIFPRNRNVPIEGRARSPGQEGPQAARVRGHRP